MALGAILLSQGLISDEQLAHAESERKRSGERLEQALARLGIASSEQTMRALAQELALPFVRLDETDIDDSAVELTLFPDGRAIVKGTTDEVFARSVYDRFVSGL